MKNVRTLFASLMMAIIFGAGMTVAASAQTAAAVEAPPAGEVAVETAEEAAEEAGEDNEEAAFDAVVKTSIRGAHGHNQALRVAAFQRLVHAKHDRIRTVRQRIRELRALPMSSHRRMNRLPLKKERLHEMRSHIKALRAKLRNAVELTP
jgi:hypothetical protein